MRSSATGQHRLASGLWTWPSVRPFPTRVFTSTGSASLNGPSPGGLRSANARDWVAATRVHPQQLADLEARATRPYVGIAALLLGALAVLSDIVGRALEQRQLAVERLQVLAENAADVVFRTATDGALEWISPSVKGLLGFTPETLQGRYGRDLVLEDDQSVYDAGLQQVAAGRKAEFEARFRAADGQKRWLAVSIRPLFNAQGHLVGRAGNWRDIQDEMVARQAEAESEQRFELAMQNSAVGMALVSPAGGFLRVNSALCTFFDRDAADLQGCTWQSLTHPDDLATDARLLEQLKAGAIPSYRQRKRFLRTDGSIVWGDLSVAPIRQADGADRPMLIMQVLDISETVQARQELIARKEQYQWLAENAADVVLQTDHHHRLRWLSPSASELFGTAAGDLIDSVFDTWVHPDDLAKLVLIRRQLEVQGSTKRPDQEQVLRLIHPEGGYRWVALRMRMLTDRGGSVAGEVLALRDVEELVAAQHKLESERQFLRSTLDSLLDPHITLEPVYDEEGQPVDFICADANKACLQYMAVDRARLVGSRLSALMPGVVDTGLMAHYFAVFQSGESLLLTDFHYPSHETLGGDYHYDIQMARSANLLTITWRDVTERYAEAERLMLSEERYRLLAENATDLVLRLRNNRVIWVSNTAQELLGAPAEHWIGKGVEELVPPEELSHYLSDLAALDQGATVTRRVRLITADGSLHWFSVHARQFLNAKGKPDGLSASLRNVDAEVAADAELDYRARHDQLTGLLNRSEALTRMEVQLGQTDQRQGRTAVLFIDVDKFKEVNDAYGHAAGDAVLQALARCLQETTRQGDLLARLGGDELLVSMPGIHSLQEVVAVAEKIRSAGAQPIEAQDKTIQTTLSIGVVLAEPGETIDGLIARADTAMHQAKQGGRNPVIPIEGPSSSLTVTGPTPFPS